LPCNSVSNLISSLHHPSDSDISRDLNLGKIPSTLTRADVTLNRTLRGPCPNQLAGKYKTAPAIPSTHAPATYCGEFIHIDGHLLSKPAIGGHTHEYLCVDEFSDKIDVVLSKSNRAADVYIALDYLFSTEYEAHGHIPGTVRADDEAINESLRPLLGARKPNPIKLLLNAPGLHAQRLERHKQTLDNRGLSTLSELPYILPTKLVPYLNRSVALALNNSIHDRIAPNTPNEIFKGTKYITNELPLPFGRSFMIPQFDDKRKRLGITHETPFKLIPKVELGVVMGPDTTTSTTKFLVSNGNIISRTSKRLHPLPLSFIPFDWKQKPYFPCVNLPVLPSTNIVSTDNNQSQTNITNSISAIPTIFPVNTLPTWSHPYFTHPTSFNATTSNNPTTHVRTGAQENKLAAQRLATTRNRLYRASLPFSNISNAPTSITPQPPPPQPRTEVSTKIAISRWGLPKCAAAEAIQLTKIMDTYKSFRPITRTQLEPNALFLRSMSLFKQKSNGEINCRIPVDGSHQPSNTYNSTFAATSDTTKRQFILSCMLKQAYDTQTQFHTFSGDIPAAFINDNPLTCSDTGGVQFFTRLPKDLINTKLADTLHN